jgi:hypothetical protein
MRQTPLLSAVLILLHLALPAAGAAAAVFDAVVGYQHKPDSDPAGIQRLVLATHEAFWPEVKGGPKTQTWPGVIDAAAEKRLADHARAWKAQGLAWICFDIEHLDALHDPATFNAFVIRTAAIVRQAAPGLKLGFYALPPFRDYYRALKPEQSAGFQAWRAENDALRPAAMTMDAIFPSLYTFYENEDGWCRYAQSNIAEARRFGLPVYPFLWPRYHDSNRKSAWKLIPLTYWKRELALVADKADAVVVWDYGQRAAWDESVPWWQAVKNLAAGGQP